MIAWHRDTFPITVPLWEESTSNQCVPLIKMSVIDSFDVCFVFSLNKLLNKSRVSNFRCLKSHVMSLYCPDRYLIEAWVNDFQNRTNYFKMYLMHGCIYILWYNKLYQNMSPPHIIFSYHCWSHSPQYIYIYIYIYTNRWYHTIICITMHIIYHNDCTEWDTTHIVNCLYHINPNILKFIFCF